MLKIVRTSDEDVVTVTQSRVLRIRHCVKRTDGERVLVHHIEVSAVLLLHQFA
jgi:hypothetical protein